MNSIQPALSVKDIHKKFGHSEILKGVSFDALPGEVISIIGSSGSGKSTLLRCINFLETANAGQITVDGETIQTQLGDNGALLPTDKEQIRRIRSTLGMVFQNFNLWEHRTVIENIIEGPILVLKQPKQQAIAKAKELLEKVGLTDKGENYPNQLSGGQKQRVAIARALAMEPKVMLFDEPTSALDPELVSEVTSVIRKLAQENRTMIMVTHEMGLARDISDKVIFLDQGKIHTQGSPEEVMINPESERLQQFLGMLGG